MAESIAVIIPFYQKKSGILTKAINSALAQTGVDRFPIIVVDDGSPVSARTELADIMREHPGRVVIIEQANGGPAAARNKGLDNLPKGTEFVAFLDSDDLWIDTHLSNASVALRAGYDFYFSDLYQINQTVSAFNRAKRIQVGDHPLIGDHPHLRAYRGDMFDQIMTGNIIGTPTVVYRLSAAPELRFRKEFVYAGEDYLFWMEFSGITKRIAFSDRCEVTCGTGVNIFAASGWGTEKSLIRLHHEIKYKKALPRLFNLNRAQEAGNISSVKALRKSFVADVLHRLMHHKPVDMQTLRDQARVDPQSFIFFFPLAVAIVLKR